MDNYHSFIGDESQIREFYRQHIGKYQNQNYYSFIIVPIARRKYWSLLSTSQENMGTKIFSSQKDEDRFVNELQLYEVKCGLYKDKKDQIIPTEALAFYITANPMNEMKAFFAMQREVSEKLEIMLTFDKGQNKKEPNMISLYKKCLHKSDENFFNKLDVDTKDPEKIETLKIFLRDAMIRPELVIETRGGYHILLNKSSIKGVKNEKLYRFIEKANNNLGIEDKWIAIEKNPLLIIPGTYQGGFLARIVNFD
jgi:hypothetical protein